jgi:3-hydroxyisobutyrate dehydrogenase-like beta-hydroxyacid dehydrogenase
MIAGERYEPAGFRVGLGLKDVRLAQAAADASAVPMPLAGLLHDRLLGLLAQGHDGLDWSSIGLAVSREAGLRQGR